MRLSAHSQSVERQRAVGGAHGRARSRLEGACPRHRLLAGGGRGSQIGERQSALAAKAWGLKHAVDHAALSVLSRLPIERSSSVALTIVQDELRQALLADMNIDGRRVLVANTHLCWRPQWTAARKTQVDVLLPAIERHGARDATLLCGDFNDDPDSAPLRAVIDSPCGFSRHLTWSPQNPYVDRASPRDQRIDYVRHWTARSFSPVPAALPPITSAFSARSICISRQLHDAAKPLTTARHGRRPSAHERPKA